MAGAHCRSSEASRRAEPSLWPEHEDADPEALAPAEGVEDDPDRRVQDHEAAKAMGGSVVAGSAPILANPVVVLQRSPLGDDPHTETVTDADAGAGRCAGPCAAAC
jgi:hypothetical protein